mmetsp:Transcript_22130/g.50014  ORF Transcript_22130/g.50014 Transcript_22130/m.50014 type:complete len:209 (-) Transcript_22130:497-1123(-)
MPHQRHPRSVPPEPPHVPLHPCQREEDVLEAEVGPASGSESVRDQEAQRAQPVVERDGDEPAFGNLRHVVARARALGVAPPVEEHDHGEERGHACCSLLRLHLGGEDVEVETVFRLRLVLADRPPSALRLGADGAIARRIKRPREAARHGHAPLNRGMGILRIGPPPRARCRHRVPDPPEDARAPPPDPPHKPAVDRHWVRPQLVAFR